MVKEQNAAYTKKALKCYEESKDEVDRKLDPVTVVIFVVGSSLRCYICENSDLGNFKHVAINR